MNPSLDDLLKEENWLEWRSLVPAKALRQTEMVTTDQTRAEFVEGSKLLRLDVRRRGADGLTGPSPIQLAIADTLNANRRFNGVLEPRRSTKTTSIQAVLLGRCMLREDYVVGWTLAKADGQKATATRFKVDIVSHLERLWPDKRNAPFKWSTSNGHEHIRWPQSGSWFNVFAPGNDAFTSGGFDVAWIDEAQDASPALTEDFLTSIPPTLDGRPGAQLVASGTAPDFRDGNLLWQMLYHPEGAHIQHGIPEDTDPELLENWETVEPLVLASHSNLGFYTSLEDVRSNFHTMSPKAFQREYLSLAGTEGGNTPLINQANWQDSTLEEMPEEPPRVFALSAFVHRDGLYASVAAAWKDKDERIHICLLHHQEGVKGFGKKLLLIARKHKRRIIFDSWSNATEVELRQLREARPRPEERPVSTRDVARAAVNFIKQLNEGNLRHYNQPELNGAAEIAVKRTFSTGNGWAFGLPKGGEELDITGLEAAALAAYVLDEEKAPGGPIEIDFF